MDFRVLSYLEMNSFNLLKRFKKTLELKTIILISLISFFHQADFVISSIVFWLKRYLIIFAGLRALHKSAILDSGRRDYVTMSRITIKVVIPAQAGIQNVLIILDSVSRFACTE